MSKLDLSPRRCVVLRHLVFEDLGVFDSELQRCGFTVEYRQAGVEPLSASDWQDADLVVVLGGPIGVYEQQRYPWLADQIEHLGLRLRALKPTLGICLGAQLMATALGARVVAGQRKEFGWAGLTLSMAGHASALRHLAAVQGLRWHGDTFDMPGQATLLATTDITPNQAFSVGTHALALQFHPEVESTRIETRLIGHKLELAQAGCDLAAMLRSSQQQGASAAIAGRKMLPTTARPERQQMAARLHSLLQQFHTAPQPSRTRVALSR